MKIDIFTGTETAFIESFLQMLRGWGPAVDMLHRTIATTQQLEPDLWSPLHLQELICPLSCFQDTWGTRDPHFPECPEPPLIFELIKIGLPTSGLNVLHLHPSWPPSVRSSVFVEVHSSASELCLHFKSIKKSEPVRSTVLSTIHMKRYTLYHISVEILRNVKRLEQNENSLKSMSETKMQ